MSYLANGRENVQSCSVPGRHKSNEMPWPEPYPLEKLNWFIHLQHVRGEILQCKELIKDEIKKSGGKNEFAHFKQGVILREEGRIQEALDSFQICMKLNPNNPRNVKEVAKCLYEMRRYRLALEAYLEAERISKSPEWQIYYNIGLCLMRLGETAKAKEYTYKSVELSKHETAYSLLIKILTLEGDLRAAASICNAAVDSCPDSVQMLTESGLLSLKMGQTQEAFEKLSSALALDPTCAKALLGIGCIIQSHEEHDVALTKYKLAVLYEPNSVALWNNIGMCFHSKQKHIAAISCLKRALWISPTNWRVLFNLGLVHLATYQPASAFNFLCAAVNLRPDVANIFIALGCALFELQDIENATRAFKQALILSPDDPINIINTALCMVITENKDEVYRLLQTFNDLLEQNVCVPKEVINLVEHLSIQLESLNEVEFSDQNQKTMSEIYPGTGDVKDDEFGGGENTLTPYELPSDDMSPREFAPDEV